MISWTPTRGPLCLLLVDILQSISVVACDDDDVILERAIVRVRGPIVERQVQDFRKFREDADVDRS